MTAYERCAWLWNETNRTIEAFKQGQNGSRVLTVRSEDLFQDPRSAQEVFEFCGLPAPSGPRLQKLISRPVNANSSSSADSPPAYKDWPEERKGDVRRWVSCAPTYGYQL